MAPSRALNLYGRICLVKWLFLVVCLPGAEDGSLDATWKALERAEGE